MKDERPCCHGRRRAGPLQITTRVPAPGLAALRCNPSLCHGSCRARVRVKTQGSATLERYTNSEADRCRLPSRSGIKPCGVVARVEALARATEQRGADVGANRFGS